jgi:arsenate reductase
VAELEILHNPACSKSRGAMQILADRGVDADVTEYLKAPPTRAELERIVDVIDETPAELVRKDKRFKELGLDASDYRTRDQVVALLVEHPELMERPVVVLGDRAVIGRPTERVSELLA